MDELIKLYTEAIAKWGGQAQLNMLYEEIGELLVELGSLLVKINKYNRNKAELEDILEEVVDTEIMLEQLTLILALTSEESDVDTMLDIKDKIRIKKIARLKSRLDAIEQHRNDAGTPE